jgi:tetratricopeptide (TPR) repeat protein
MGLMSEPALQSAVRHHQAGRLAEAEALYRQVLVDHPGQSDALHLLGVIAHQSGRPQEALELINRAIQTEPARAEFHGNLAIVLAERGDWGSAIVALNRALELRPDFPQALSNLGSAYKIAGQWDRSIAVYRQWVTRCPNDAEGWDELGTALEQDRQFDQAVVAYRQAIQLRPDWIEAREHLVKALGAADQGEAAVAAAREALERWPESADARIILAAGLSAAGKLDEATAECRRAVESAPGNARCHYQLGSALRNLGLLQAAIGEYRRAISIDANFAEAHRDLGLLLMQRREFESGFAEYEWRWKLPGLWVSPLEKAWKGKPLEGRTVLLRYEGGHGDTIQMARFCRQVTECGGKVIFQCEPELLRLLRELEGVNQLVSSKAPEPKHDLYCMMLSLPMALKVTAEAIPATIPYLYPDEGLKERWGARLASLGERQKNVGLVWAGGPRTAHDRLRSLALELLAPLRDIPGVRYISLQKGKPASQARQAEHGLHLIDWTDELVDWADTAALIANLDLIISVDTAMAHLAGAMGKPVWVMLPWPSDWRWLLDREDSLWYPTMRLFRQTNRGDWTQPVARIVEALRQFVAK